MLASYKKSLRAAFIPVLSLLRPVSAHRPFSRTAGIIRTASAILLSAFLLSGCVLTAFGQSINSGTVTGTVEDQTGAVVSGATVEISNALTGYQQTTKTDENGSFRFNNVPFNPYHLAVTHTGFNTATQDVAVRSTIPANVNIALGVAGSQQTVFLSRQLPPCSIIRPTETKGAAMGAVKALTGDGLFIGQSTQFMQLLQDLASDADKARREGH